MIPSDRYYRCACGRLWRQAWTGGFAYGAPTYGPPREIDWVPSGTEPREWKDCPKCGKGGEK